MYNVGSKIKFRLLYEPYVTGLGTIKEIYIGPNTPCIYRVEIEEIEDYYVSGEDIFIFPKEVVKRVYFD